MSRKDQQIQSELSARQETKHKLNFNYKKKSYHTFILFISMQINYTLDYLLSLIKLRNIWGSNPGLGSVNDGRMLQDTILKLLTLL